MKNFLSLFILSSLLIGFIGCSHTKQDESTLIILSTADVHGHVFPWDYYSDEPDEPHSLLKVATLVDSVKSRQPNTILLDAGDWLQGNPFAEFFARVDTTGYYPFLQTLDFLEFDGVVVGNHEFNFGLPHLHYREEQTNTPFMAANAVRESDGVPAYTPYIIREIDGYKIGVIALTTPGSAVWDRPRVEGILRFEDGVETARLYTEKLYNEGADVIIMVMHSGFEGSTSYTSDTLGPENFGRLIADEVPGVHAIIASHTHRVIDDLIHTSDANPQGVAVTQPGRWASHLGYTELNLHRNEEGQAVVRFGPNRALSVEHARPHQELYDLLLDDHERVRSYINEPVATTDSLWDSSDARLVDRAITDLIQRVQLEATGADLSSTAIFNTNARFEEGVITRGSLARLYPYENTLYTIRISGAELREYLEFSARFFAQITEDGQTPESAGVTPGFNFDVLYGASYTINLRNPVGERIENLTYNGQPVQDTDSFTLALNSYRAVGGGDFDMIARAEVLDIKDVSVRLLIEEYLAEKGHINPEDVANSFWNISF
ncbi:MAG: 5'-nucleotidase C-terminal domain-containing protein [Balneolia bacterium]|nr:5'-nucleotidase C-terminal domain-containing protein [Balneolia bacterium]